MVNAREAVGRLKTRSFDVISNSFAVLLAIEFGISDPVNVLHFAIDIDASDLTECQTVMGMVRQLPLEVIVVGPFADLIKMSIN